MDAIALWVLVHGQDSLQVVGIVAGLVFTALGLRTDTRSRRIQTLITLTRQHREIWVELARQPGLRRVAEAGADLHASPVTAEEIRFVGFVILHINCWFRAERAGEVCPLEGFERDLRALFSLPVAAAVWQRQREFLESDFVEFVENVLNAEARS